MRILIEDYGNWGWIKDIKKENLYKMKHVMIYLYVSDLQIVKQFLRKEIFDSISEIIRFSLVYYLYFSTCEIVNDWNQGFQSYNDKKPFGKKTGFSMFIPKGLIKELLKKYENFTFSTIVRNIFHYFVLNLKFKKELKSIGERDN